jgi:hypothetical protein
MFQLAYALVLAEAEVLAVQVVLAVPQLRQVREEHRVLLVLPERVQLFFAEV